MIRKILKRILISSMGLVFFYFAFNNSINLYANEFVDYSSYFQDSDEIYDMSNKNDIVRYEGYPEIQNYMDCLIAKNIEYKISNNKVIACVYGDDPIINIVPKEYFYNEITEVVIGKEYIYFISTVEIENSLYETYLTVIDINDNIYSNDLADSYVKMELKILFEYKFITLKKGFDYEESKHNVLEDYSWILHGTEFSSEINDDYVVVPELYYSTLMIEERNEVALSDIGMRTSFYNTTDYNPSDQQYNKNDDNGYYVTGVDVDYHATNYSSKLEPKCKTYLKKISAHLLDYFGFLPIVGNVIGAGQTVYDFAELCDYFDTATICEILSSESSFSTQTNLMFTNKFDQINNYDNLIKSYAAKYDGPSMMRGGDYVESKFQYGYTREAVYSSKPSTTVYCDTYFKLTYKGISYDAFISNRENINLEDNNVDVDEIINDEYLIKNGEINYIYNSIFTQELIVECGNNDVLIFEDEKLVSTTNKYLFKKGNEYIIKVVNNNQDKSIYDFYLKGYDINDVVTISSKERVLYSLVGDSNGFRYVTSNIKIESEDVFFQENGKVNQFVLFNNSDYDMNVNISYNEIDNAIISNEEILNNSKYVLFNTDKYIWLIDYFGSDHDVYYVVDNDLIKMSARCIVANKLVLLNTYNISKIHLLTENVEIYYENYTLTDNFNYLSYDSTGIVTWDCPDDVNVHLVVYALYHKVRENDENYDNLKLVNDVSSSQIKLDCGYGIYEITLVMNISQDNDEDASFQVKFTITYVPNENSIKYLENKVEKYGDSFISRSNIECYGIIRYLDAEIVVNNSSIQYYFSNDKSILLIKKAYTSIDIIEENITFSIIFHQTYVNYKIRNICLIGDSSLLRENYTNNYSLKISPFRISVVDYGFQYHIFSFTQLSAALTYGTYGSYSYDDGMNYEAYVYGNINRYNFILDNDIDCTGKTINISKSIIFSGIFDGNHHSISGLTIEISNYDDVSSNRGLFSENYGEIKSIYFFYIKMDLSGYKDAKKLNVGFLSPINRGEINDCTLFESYVQYNTVSKKGKVTSNSKRINSFTNISL